MLTKDEIRKAVLERLTAVEQSCNSTHITHNTGTIRGLLWALNGKDPGTLRNANTPDVLTLAGIPWRDVDNKQIEHATPGDADWPKDD